MTITASQHKQHQKVSRRYHEATLSKSMELALQESRRRELARQKAER